jgi:hypothetical protein
MRYVMRIAEFSESSNLWTQIALSGYAWEHASLSIGSIYLGDVLIYKYVRPDIGRLGWSTLTESS